MDGGGAVVRLRLIFLVFFVCSAIAIAALATWAGLMWADRADLPMPLLRAFEDCTALPTATPLVTWGLGWGVAVGAASLAMSRFMDAPPSVIALATVGNGIAGLCFGWLYARKGYEALIIAHLTAHAIAVRLA